MNELQPTVSNVILAEGGVNLVQGMVVFLIAGLAMVLGALILGRFLRPKLPNAEKLSPYECGEPTIGRSWVQFDVRFYVVALVFLIFDIEIALFYPWAVVYGGGATPGVDAETLQQVRWAALFDMLFFFGVIVVGFLYLWRFGYLDWVRAISGQSKPTLVEPPAPKRSTTAAG